MSRSLRKLLLLLAPGFMLSACDARELDLAVAPLAEGYRFDLRYTPEGGPHSLTFSSGKRMDVVVRGPDGSDCWRWSDGRMFTMALATVHLAAGETFHHSLSWDGRCADGAVAAPGRYTATAEIPLARLDDRPLETPLTVTRSFDIP